MSALQMRDRVRGGILGVVVGDALGVPVEFRDREWMRRSPVATMTGFGTYKLPPGTWSDDSSLTLCQAESLLEQGFNLRDTGLRFVKWMREGYCTPFGETFDVGATTRSAICRLEDGLPPEQAGLDSELSNGNGSLMRILPAALFFHPDDPEPALGKIAEVSALTHRHPHSILGCQIYTLVAWELLKGSDPATAYRNLCHHQFKILERLSTASALDCYKRILNGELAQLEEDQIRSDGYVVHTLEASLWCLLHGGSFRETVLMAVNLGEDSDTTGAVTGGLAGVYYGYPGIPEEWIQKLARRAEVLDLVDRFADRITQG